MLQREPMGARVLHDAASFFVLACIVGVVLAAALYLPAIDPPWLDLTGRVVAALTAQLAVVATLRLLIPRTTPGTHLIGQSWDYTKCLLSAALNEVALHPLVRAPFWFFHVTRFLYLRALGANLSLLASVGADVTLRDPSLIEIEDGSKLEQGVIIENAIHAVGRIQVGKVAIGGGCLVGAHAIMMPGTTLGHDARISPRAYLGTDARVGVGAKIGEGAMLSSQVEVGTNAVIEAGAVLSDGVIVADGARVIAGVSVPANTVLVEREVYVGGQEPRPLPSIAPASAEEGEIEEVESRVLAGP